MRHGLTEKKHNNKKQFSTVSAKARECLTKVLTSQREKLSKPEEHAQLPVSAYITSSSILINNFSTVSERVHGILKKKK